MRGELLLFENDFNESKNNRFFVEFKAIEKEIKMRKMRCEIATMIADCEENLFIL